MEARQNILEAYRAADDEKRLFLFLECRAYRDQFVQIEHEEYLARLQERIASGKKPESRSFCRSLRAGFAFGKS
jgi:hypothetical protein